MKRSFGAILLACLLAVPAVAQIVVDHQPTRSGGPAADTDFINMFGQQSWQLEADDFTLSAPVAIRRVSAWGFYDQDNPPVQETMRIRFYQSRPGDGFPDTAIHTQEFSTYSRVPTGQVVLVGIEPREFFFTFDLQPPLALSAGTPYWLEFAQIGDVNSQFRWEHSIDGNRIRVFTNPSFSDWTLASGADLAFQLSSIPEPATGLLVVNSFWLAVAALRRSVRRLAYSTRREHLEAIA